MVIGVRIVNLFLTVTGKFSVMIGTVLYNFGSSKRSPNLKNTDLHPFEIDIKERHSLLLMVLLSRQLTETGISKYVTHGR